MKYQTIVFYLVIPLALFSLMSLLENVQAQTNSSNQTLSSPQQQMNMTAQALMKTDIDGIKDTLAKAKLEILQGNLKDAVQDIRDVETQLLLIEPSPTKLLNNVHKTTNALAKSDIYKALDMLTNVQVTILKAESQIFKVAFVNPQVMEQFVNIEENTNQEDSSEIEDDNPEDDTPQQFNNIETDNNEEDYEE